VTVKLATRGKQRLRATLTVGSQTIVSPEISTTVAAATRPKQATAGTYKGKVGNGTQSATFTLKGRTIKNFTAQVPMTCPSVNGTITTQIGTAKFKSVKLAPDGSFVGVNTAPDTSMRVRGKLVKAKLTGGRVELSVGACVGNISYQVKRS
jgi:hypothetical protein